MAKTNIQRKVAAKLNAACDRVNAEIIQSLFPQNQSAKVEQLSLFAQAILDAAAQNPVVVEEEQPKKTVSVLTGWKPSKELKAAVKAYKKAAVAKKAAERAAIIAEIKAAGMDDVEEFFGADFKIIFAEYPQTRVLSKELEERLPEVYAQFSETKMIRPLKVN